VTPIVALSNTPETKGERMLLHKAFRIPEYGGPQVLRHGKIGVLQLGLGRVSKLEGGPETATRMPAVVAFFFCSQP
jgi:hypothetical protein